jgi:hypothetical protein
LLLLTEFLWNVGNMRVIMYLPCWDAYVVIRDVCGERLMSVHYISTSAMWSHVACSKYKDGRQWSLLLQGAKPLSRVHNMKQNISYTLSSNIYTNFSVTVFLSGDVDVSVKFWKLSTAAMNIDCKVSQSVIISCSKCNGMRKARLWYYLHVWIVTCSAVTVRCVSRFCYVVSQVDVNNHWSCCNSV